MEKIILTSDKYSFCVEGFQELLKRHWKDPEAKFTVLGFNPPKVELNDNLTFESLGENFNDNSHWKDTLTPFLNKMEGEFFFIAFEDHFLVDDVNLDLFNKAEEIMKNDKSVGKVRLLPKYKYHDNRKPFNDLKDYDEDFHIGPTAPNTFALTSLRPSIWRKSLFMRLLNNPRGVKDPHDFEKMNNVIDFHDETVIIPKGDYPIYPDIDAMRHGRPNPQAANAGTVDMNYYWQPISKEDVIVFNENKKRWGNR